MHCLKLSILSLLVAVLSVIIYVNIRKLLCLNIIKPASLEEKWWGPGPSKNESTRIEPFKIRISDEILDDLKHRLDNAIPLQEPLENVQQQYGINTNFLKTFVEFWRTKYNWREREDYLNQYPQYVTRIQGLKIHFLHVKPETRKGIRVHPLMILHGWPGSIREFYDIIPILTTPQKGRDFVFEIIAPSLPGYAFSDAAVRPGMIPTNMAVIFNTLMKRLGITKYYLQGGDWGSMVADQLATFYPESIIGIHLNFCIINTPRAHAKMIVASLLPKFYVEPKLMKKLLPLYDRLKFLIEETGYMHIQGTKPDTVGVGLRDSPVGLAAYMLEKFSTLTDPAFRQLEDAGFSKKFTFTSLLDNIMIYWVTRSMTSSMRIYYETFNSPDFDLMRLPIEDVPTGCARYFNDVVAEPEWILRDKYLNLIYVADYDQGHFAAFEAPETFAEDLFRFVGKLERLAKEPTEP